MSDQSPPLPPLRRVVTAHDAQGRSVVASDLIFQCEPLEASPKTKGGSLWVQPDGIPTNDNNTTDDVSKRIIDNPSNFNLVPPAGASLRCTELAPGGFTPMHRTNSVDYNVLVSGELVLITEDGTETHLKNPGDSVIQRGTNHAWRNPRKDQHTRWLSVLIAAHPAVVNGDPIPPTISPYVPKE